MKKLLLTGVITTALTAYSFAATVVWDFSTNGTPSSGTPVTNLTVSDLTTVNSSLAFNSTSASTGYTGASGGNNAAVSAVLGTVNATTSTYFTFTLTPSGGNEVSVSSISLGSRSTASGPVLFTLRSSADGFTSDVGTAALTNDSVWRLISPVFAPVSSGVDAALTFRLYGSGGSSTASNWRIDDLRVTADVVPEPSALLSMAFGAGILILRRRRH